MIHAARSLAFLWRLSLRRQLRSRKVLILLVLLAASAVAVFILGLREPWTLRRFGEGVALRIFTLFYVPLVSLALGAGAISDERSSRTLVYLVTRPLPRSGIYIVKWLAAAPIALAVAVGGLWVLCAVAAAVGKPEMDGAFGLFWPAVLLGTLAYTSLFHLLGGFLRHAILVSLAWVFFVEAFVGRVPGILKRVSISFYTWSVIYDDAAGRGIEPRARAIFLPLDGETASWVLVGLTGAFLTLGALLFARKEHVEGG